MMQATQAIEHHQKIMLEVEQMTKAALYESLPVMKELRLYTIEGDGSHVYDATKIDGEIIFTVQCKDGICFLVQLPKGSLDR